MKKRAASKYQHLLISDFQHRVYPLLYALAIAFLLFGLLNEVMGNQVMFSADVCFAAFLATIGYTVKHEVCSPSAASSILLLAFAGSILSVYILPYSFHEALYGYASTPFFALYIIGSRRGVVYCSLIFTALWLAWVCSYMQWFQVSYSLQETAMFTSLFVFNTWCAWMFERAREQKFIESYQEGLHRESLLTAVDAVYYKASMDGNLLEVGAAITPLTGYAVDELLGHPILEFYAHPAERDSYIAQLQKEGRVKNYPVWLIKKNGQNFNVSMSAMIIFNQQREPQYIEGVFLDITQETQVAKEREEHFYHLKSLSAIEGALSAPSFGQSIEQAINALLPIFEADRAFLLPIFHAGAAKACSECDGKVFLAQKDDLAGFCAVGFLRDEGVRSGLALRDNDNDNDNDNEFCPEIIDKSSIFSPQVIEKYNIKANMMICISTVTGEEWLLVVQRCTKVEPWTKQHKDLLIDISHRLRAAIGQLTLQRDLQVNVERAEVASKAKGDFLATMSHELRTPLHGVIGLLGLLEIEESRLSDEQRDNLALAQSTAHILGSLIDDVLDLSKIEAGKVELEHKVFTVEDTLCCALVPFVMKAKEKGLELNLNMDGVAKEMLGDALRLRQVLLNLVGNALKFTHKGYVRIDSWQKDGQWHITIKDSGIGIAEEKAKHVFDPFEQVHLVGSEQGDLQQQGTGLGTTISKHFIEMMKGSITLKSALGEGSTFHIQLPLHAVGDECISAALGIDDFTVKLAARRVKKAEEYHESGKKWSVLLAEDDPIGRKIALKQLKRVGFQVTTAADGLTAFQLAREHHFDLLLTDIRMPGMDGMQLTKMIREYEQVTEKERMMIIGLSAHALEDVKHEALAHGMDEFISKPVDMQSLMHKLEHANAIAVA
ncbi:MAG: response regulator [Ghiorsea sp.]